MLDLKFSSWNVRGFNKIVKLKQVLDRINQLKGNIIFLQESHLLREDTSRVSKRWPWQVFSAPYTSHTRGVIHKSVPFQMHKQYVDPQGRFIILNELIVNIQVTLISIYAPNEDDPSFYQNLFYTISTYSWQYVIGGDFNCVLDIQLDRSTGIDSTHLKSRKIIKKIVKDLHLTEIWRHLNPNKREYSCFSNTHKTYSRIDYFIVSSNLLSKIERCWYFTVWPCSNFTHNAVY